MRCGKFPHNLLFLLKASLIKPMLLEQYDDQPMFGQDEVRLSVFRHDEVKLSVSGDEVSTSAGVTPASLGGERW